MRHTFRGIARGRYVGALELSVFLFCTLFALIGRAEPEPSSSKAPKANAPKVLSRAISFEGFSFPSEEQSVAGASHEEMQTVVEEELQATGLKVIASQGSTFGDFHPDEAELVLSGQFFKLICDTSATRLNCVVGLEWVLKDLEAGEVLYRARTFGSLHKSNEIAPKAAAASLVRSALSSLLSKKKFRSLTRATNSKGKKATSAVILKRCSSIPTAPETNSDPAMDSIAVVKTEEGIGSAFFISDDPFLITAAHVATSKKVEVYFRNGHKSVAETIVVNRRADVALLRIKQAPETHSCLQAADSSQFRIGAPLYALGAPAGERLAFSMSRGILSGVRLMGSTRHLQTDASISPGNSGGPLVNSSGQVLGVTSWKLTGDGVEGLGFAISIDDALSRLRVSFDDMTSAAAFKLPPISKGKSSLSPYEEKPDREPTLDPESVTWTNDERDERAKRREAILKKRRIAQLQKERTPVYVPIMKWGGLTLAIGGTGLIIGSAIMYDSSRMDVNEYQTVRLLNDIGWITAGLGTASFIISFPLTPKVTEADLEAAENAQASAEVGVTAAGQLAVRGSF